MYYYNYFHSTEPSFTCFLRLFKITLVEFSCKFIHVIGLLQVNLFYKKIPICFDVFYKVIFWREVIQDTQPRKSQWNIDIICIIKISIESHFRVWNDINVRNEIRCKTCPSCSYHIVSNEHLIGVQRPWEIRRMKTINGQNKWNTQISIAPIRIFLH